jgi:biopolymer transport protein ExbD
MGMSVGGGGRQRAEINVTPMIDVLLVLIIIFLVITPSNERGLRALVPQQSDTSVPEDVVTNNLVVSVSKDRVIEINQEPIAFEALPERLAALHIKVRGAHFFVRGDRGLDFQDVAQVIDIARGAGWNEIGLMTR